MNLLESGNQRDRVKRLILDPLKGRGEPPRGWTEEKLMIDYVLVLGEYPEDVLARAAAKVHAERTRTSWPLAGEFRDACEKLGGKETAKPAGPVDERVQVSVAAHGYVSRRMNADNASLLLRSLAGGWQLDCKRWLFNEACKQIRAGQEPHISAASLEAQIAVWSIDGEARRRSQAAIMAPKRARPVSAVQRAIRQPEFVNDETARHVAAARGEPMQSDLDEEIPLPASEDDYGAEAAAE